MLLEQNHDQYNDVKHVRDVKEQGLLGVRNEYKTTQLQQNLEKKKGGWRFVISVNVSVS